MKITKEEKLKDIAEARELYIEAGKLIEKANKLIARNVRDVMASSSTLDIYRPLEASDVCSNEYVGLVPIHLFKGITRLEKAVGVP